MKKYIFFTGIVLSGLLVFQNCSKSSSSDNTQAQGYVDGLDFSGKYKITSIVCYNKQLTSSTTSAPILESEIVEISGNTITSTSVANDCTVVVTSDVKFIDSRTMNLTNIKVASATNGSCSQTSTLDVSNGSTIVPTTKTNTYNQGDRSQDVIGAYYVRNSSNGFIGIYNSFKNSKNSDDLCFSILGKY